MKYEYKILQFSHLDMLNIPAQLNDWGEKGWEVIHVFLTSPPTNTSLITKVVYHLKKEVTNIL